MVDADAPLDVAVLELKEGAGSPPKGEFDAPNDAVIFPKPNDVPDDEGGLEAGMAFSSSGLDVLYFCASFANMSGSLPLYFSNVGSIVDIFDALCFW